MDPGILLGNLSHMEGDAKQHELRNLLALASGYEAAEIAFAAKVLRVSLENYPQGES